MGKKPRITQRARKRRVFSDSQGLKSTSDSRVADDFSAVDSRTDFDTQGSAKSDIKNLKTQNAQNISPNYKNSRILRTSSKKDSRKANKCDSHKAQDSSEIRLDYLPNPPLNTELSRLIIPNHAFYSIADKEATGRIESARATLKKRFGKNSVLPFNFSASGFVELFLGFKKIYFLPTIHYEIRHALEIVRPFTEQVQLSAPAKLLESDILLPNDKQKDEILMIAPLINEDIFSLNQIPEIRNATLALDISYALALGLEEIYNIECQKAHIALANAVPLGLPSGFGLIFSDKIRTSSIYRNGVSEAFLGAIDERRLQFKRVDKNANLKFFEALKSHFNKHIDLFSRDFVPHTLPLRFRHINTRYLVEHLYLDNIFLQNAQDCALGLVKPSHTLLSQGFSPMQSRELCAVSFESLGDMELLAQKLFESYRMIRLMEF